MELNSETTTSILPDSEPFLEDQIMDLFEIGPDTSGPKFNYYLGPINNKKPLQEISLSETYHYVTTDFFKAITEYVRNNPDQKIIVLPYITVSGVFRERTDSAIISYTGYVCLDYDDCPAEFKNQIINDPDFRPCLVFTSPGGKGVKVVIHIINAKVEEHPFYYTTLSQLIFQKYKVKADPSCKNVSRACFLCYDPEAYFSKNTIDRESLLKATPPPPPPFSAEEVFHTLPPAPPRPSDLLNRMPEIYEKATSLLRLTGWSSKGELWFRPGKMVNEGHAAILNIDPADGLYKFTNYSTHALPFLCQGYTLVGIINEISYGGDFRACIADLSKQYLNQTNNKLPMTSEKQQTIQTSLPDPYFLIRHFPEVITDGSKAKAILKIAGAFLRQDTNTLFFSRTNVGKSLLGFQVAYAAATATSIDPHPALCNECPPILVLYVDLEMDEKTIYDRHHIAMMNTSPLLMKNLIFLHENPGIKPVFNLELLAKIEKAAMENHAQLIIIDNISKLIPDLCDAVNVSCVIETMKRVRQKIGASFLVIGHTTKSDSRTAITPQSYYGSAHLQNFFTEVFYMDATRDGNFFLCHSKTKRAECYDKEVPVFSRGAHPVVGVGFTFKNIQPITDVQLPLTTSAANARGNLSDYRNEIIIMQQAGIKPKMIAEIFGVNRSSISRFLKTVPQMS